MKKLTVSVLCLSFLLCIFGCGTEPPTVKEKVLFEIEEQDFIAPLKEYRPIWNLYGINSAVLDNLNALGFGGVTTNVSYANYLESTANFEALRAGVEYAKSLGLRVWLFDEKGWPSGKAGGLVLRDNPELEAQGLVCLTKPAKGGNTVTFSLPIGHTKAVYAYAVEDSTGAVTDLTDSLASNGSLTFSPAGGGDYTVYYLVQKPFYEGTHAVNNWVEQLRYPDFLRKDSTEKFIGVTHDQYKNYLGEYFGDTVEAIFTEEPQLLGYYMGEPPVTPANRDPLNPDLPLYATLNFSDTLLAEFETRRGYSLQGKAGYLFGGEGEAAMQVRLDYHKTVSELYFENYNQVIGDWCKQNGIAYSGHFLFEEYTVHHAMFIGNILQQLGALQIPGVDMLSTLPAVIQDYAVTSLKYGQSAAAFHGRPLQMAELSSSIDNITYGIDEMKGNAAIHAAYGYNRITSFYPHAVIDSDVTKAFNEYSGRLSYLIRGGRHKANVAVYYPEESVFASTLPSNQKYMGYRSSINYGSEADKVDFGIKRAVAALAQNQIDYDFLDSAYLRQCSMDSGELVTPSGQRFKAIVLPYLNAVPADVLELLADFQSKGLYVLADSTSNVFAANKTAFDKLKNYSYANASTMITLLKNMGVQDFTVSKNMPALRYSNRVYDNASNFLLVNSGENAVSGEFTFKVQAKKVTIYDPDRGTAEVIAFNTNTAGEAVLNLSLSKYKALMVSIEV